jgi:hypothetical protein
MYGVQISFGWTFLGVPSHHDATNGVAVSHVSKNQAGILMQDELQLERHQAAHDHHVRFERTLLRGFVVISLL